MRLDVKDLYFSYGDKQVLRGITLSLDRPGLYCIIGPNGVGKSTLVKCLNRLLTPSSGKVELNGKNISEMSFGEISRVIGYIPVRSEEGFSTTVFEAVLLGRFPHRKWGSTSEDYRIVSETMKITKIEDLAFEDTFGISAGQHQRVMIAKGLAQQPSVLILDEPTANLDARYQISITRLLHKLAIERDMIVVMISHDLNIASRFADKVLLMTEPGVLFKMGDAHEVVTKENIRYAYGVDCNIIDVKGRPHVILLDELPDDEVDDMHHAPNIDHQQTRYTVSSKARNL